MDTKFRLIEVSNFTNKNAQALWDGRKIDTHTTIDLNDFDFGADAEKELEACQTYITKMEQEQGWIPGHVTAYIAEYPDPTETEH